MKVETPSVVLSTHGLLSLVADRGGCLLCVGAEAAWMVVGFGSDDSTEMRLFVRETFGDRRGPKTDLYREASRVTVGLSMSTTPLRLLRDAITSNLGHAIMGIEATRSHGDDRDAPRRDGV